MQSMQVITAGAMLFVATMLTGCASGSGPAGASALVDSDAGTASGEDIVPWTFIESVGGLALGEPYIDTDDVLWIPVDVDFSGARTISVAPTRNDTGMRCLMFGPGNSGPDETNHPRIWEMHVSLIAIDEGSEADGADCGKHSLPLVFIRSMDRVPEAMTFRVYYGQSRTDRHLIGEFQL